MAHGSIPFVRARRIPVVSSLAAAISDVDFDPAAHRLDCEHCSYLRTMAPARTRASMGGASWLGDAVGIWIYCNRRRNNVVAQDRTATYARDLDITVARKTAGAGDRIYLYPGA